MKEKNPYFRLTLITTHQNSIEKARNFSKLIQKKLNTDIDFKISKYGKLTDSFKIFCIGKLNTASEIIPQLIELSDRICSPWIVNYDRNEHTIELLFQSEHGQFRKNEFNVIHWALMEVEYL